MELKDWLKSINTQKIDIMNETNEDEYNPYVMNTVMKRFPDAIGFANYLNINTQLPKRLQYDFYLYGLRKKSRFTNVNKKQSNVDINAIKEYYQVNEKRAEEYLKLLGDNIKEIHKCLNKGGKI